MSPPATCWSRARATARRWRPADADDAPLVEVSDLSVQFVIARGDGARGERRVSFSVRRGEVLCILGESGSGKSVTPAGADAPAAGPGADRGRCAASTASDVLALPRARLRELRGGARLDDLPGADDSARSGLHDRRSRSPRPCGGIRACSRARGARPRAGTAGAGARSRPPRGGSTNYPHELSGGLRQRAMIAHGAVLLARSCCWRTSRPPRWMRRCRSRC